MHPQILRLIEEQEEEKGEFSLGFPLSGGVVASILVPGIPHPAL